MDGQRDTPKQRKARALIDKIAREHTLDGRIVGTRFESLVSNCLEILSNQLYEKSTHFLLELIQNADDNTYDCPNPTLSFSYKPGAIRVDCNEIGFAAENVEAICAINQSSKSGKTNDGEYIGEKGIGFKSVFKAADIVWISSREFTFKFDHTKPLGMVMPIWATFPETTMPGWTSMYLQLSKDYEEQTLRDELLTFDANLLIFLRRIEEINIRVADQGGQVQKKRVRKIEEHQGEDRVILLHSDDDAFNYLIRTYTIKDLPKEPKRPNWAQTKIMLAFPTVNRSEQPRILPQKVYAFLPIRNYGLKFLIQGDFLLTASREDIESTLPWNRRIRDALAEAFLQSVYHFNKGNLKYVWPHYVPSPREVASSFLGPAITSILTQLGDAPVLESCAGTMVKPSSLKYIPLDSFVDGEGRPFTLTSHTAVRYLSMEYPAWVVESMGTLGVSKITPQDFLEDLNSAITHDPARFHERPGSWHSQLAEALVKISTDTELLSTMQDICLIPLQDGNWTSARGQSMFFAKNETSLEIPSGIDVSIVDSSAGSDPNRRKLFTALGVKSWEAPEVCRLILKIHESSDFDPKSLTKDQLISHAVFLHKASWQPPDSTDIWFATMQDGRCRGRKLYIPGSAVPNSPAGRVFAQLQKKFAVIHEGYLNALGLGSGWPLWLVSNLGLSMVPRLIYPHVKPRPQPVFALKAPDEGTAQMDSEPNSLDVSNEQGADSGPFIPPPPTGQKANALQDYQMKLMLLEQQNKKRLLMARTELGLFPNMTLPPPQAFTNVPRATVNAEKIEPMQPSRGNREAWRRDDASGQRRYTSLTGHVMSPAQATFIRDPETNAQSILPVDVTFPAYMVAKVDSPSPDPNEEQRLTNGPLKNKALQVAKTQAEGAGDVTSREPQAEVDSLTPSAEIDENFALSEEFSLMFQQCNSSDVLQILRDNWSDYSQWIDGAHMQWQGPDFVKSSNQLRSDIGSCSVQTAKASLPLQESVLKMIDRQLDESCIIPSLKIEHPQHPEWTLLNHFGVIIKGDIHYYLRCLIGISGELRPDVNTIVYIYEKIQDQYTGNEDLIRAAFYERDLVYLPSASSTSTKSTGWTNMRECVSGDSNIESEYKTCAYLLRCLLSPSGDPIASLVFAATSITSSNKLEQISRLFRDINTALKNVNTSKAAQLLRPLQKNAIFPITDGHGKGRYSRLLDARNTSWFIADRISIRESFTGKLPLLALPVEDLEALRDLFSALRLNDRMLSTRATSTTEPKGRLRTHWTYTDNFRSKSPFIKALIPHSHCNRTRLEHQIDGLRISVATNISQQFTLDIAGIKTEGNPTRGQVARSDARNNLNLFITEEGAADECAPYELVNLVADACEINDPNHRSLLHIALSSSNIEKLVATFQQNGFYIKDLRFQKSRARYRAQRGHLLRIPSPFWGNLNQYGSTCQVLPETTRFGGFLGGRSVFHPGGDRRLPMINIIGGNGSVFDDTTIEGFAKGAAEVSGWDNLQHLGEHLISKLLYTHLGPAYSPERHWTSEFRTRSGYPPFSNLTSCAAFTLNELEIQDRMTDFVIKYGHSQMPNWSKRLRLERPVYHLDVAVSTGAKASLFVLSTAQIELMQRLKMHDDADAANTNVYILVRVSDVYSEDLISIDILLDPWRLFDSNCLTLEGTWIVRGALQEKGSEPTRKRRRIQQPALSWAMPAMPGEPRTINPRSRRTREAYTYRPLGDGYIRLLYLLPGEMRDRLQGMIFHTSYQSSKDYRALSYVWGTDQRTQQITTADGILGITLSLSHALRGLRRKDKAITVWVDAVCINQDDHSEKAQQIRLLPRIFQNAKITYAFLEGGKGSDAAIEMLMQIRVKAALEAQLRADADKKDELDHELEHESTEDLDSEGSCNVQELMTSMNWPEDLPPVPRSWNDRCMPPKVDAIWGSVKALFALPWFRRAWIIQEIVAAPNVQIICGKWNIDWNDLHCAVEIIDCQLQLSGNESSSLRLSLEPFLALAAQREWEARQYRWTLIMLLEHFRYAESTLSRDRLFALLGLASDGNEEAFVPDYDCKFEEVVLRFAREFVRQGRGIQLLYRAGLGHQPDRFPSWIPDWTVKRPDGLHDSSENGVSFEASGALKVNIRCVLDTDELIVEGYEVDVIQSISTSSNFEEEWATYFEEVDAMAESAVLSPVPDSPDDIKWKVPIAGVLYPKAALDGVTDLQSSYRAFRSYIRSKQKGKGVDRNQSMGDELIQYALVVEAMDADSNQKQSMSYAAALKGTLSGWRFVVTKKGYVGVVPNMTQAGDVVVILKGGLVPFILLKSELRPKAFRFVGACYVHGMMNGEGLMLQGVAEREFCIH